MKILVIPDTHAPFAHADALDFLRDQRRQLRPDAVVHIGDLGDQLGWCRHGRAPDAPGQADEDRATLAWVGRLTRLFPRVRVCVGNHDLRLTRAAQRAGIPSRLHSSLAAIYSTPRGWRWADRWVIDGVCYQHGDGYSGADCAMKAAKNNRCNTAIGHVHSAAGVRYHANGVDVIWGMSVGCLIDSDAFGLAYAARSAAKPVLGCGMVIDGIPSFIPMV
jgi:predicted phosphodiesterase